MAPDARMDKLLRAAEKEETQNAYSVSDAHESTVDVTSSDN